MKCPFCRQTNTEVYNSRHTKFGTQTWRRRRCLSCEQTFTTYEAPSLDFLRVTNKSGKQEHYSRSKLFSSLYAAFTDIPGKDTTIDAVTATVEAKILDTKSPGITSRDIANIVLTTLKHFNTTAFIRYLSVHTELISNAQLKNELKKY